MSRLVWELRLCWVGDYPEGIACVLPCQTNYRWLRAACQNGSSLAYVLLWMLSIVRDAADGSSGIAAIRFCCGNSCWGLAYPDDRQSGRDVYTRRSTVASIDSR